MTLKEMFAKIDAQRASKLFVVRIEIRGIERKHEFENITEAKTFWDKAHKYGMNIDPRPE
jgi:hypothetical protein